MLVVTRDVAVPVLRRIIVAAVTRTVRDIPTELPLGPREGLPVTCAANFDDIQPIRRALLTQRVGSDGVGLGHDIVSEHPRAAAVGAHEGREHADRRRLARAVRAEHPVDRSPPDAEIDTVDGTRVTERPAHAITETPSVQEALDHLGRELGTDRVELGELVVLGVGAKLATLRALITA